MYLSQICVAAVADVLIAFSMCILLVRERTHTPMLTRQASNTHGVTGADLFRQYCAPFTPPDCICGQQWYLDCHFCRSGGRLGAYSEATQQPFLFLTITHTLEGVYVPTETDLYCILHPALLDILQHAPCQPQRKGVS